MRSRFSGLLQPSDLLQGICSASSQGLNCGFVQEMVNDMKALRSETELLLAGRMALVSCVGCARGRSGQTSRP